MAPQCTPQGRDHGTPGYAEWRAFCDLPAVRDFSDLGDVMGSAAVAALRAAYRDVRDIDLFTGGLAEIPNKVGVVSYGMVFLDL